MKKVLFISKYRYPEGDAGSLRQNAFAKIFRENNFEVKMICMGEYTNFEYKKDSDNIDYLSLRYEKNDLYHKVLQRILFKRHLKSIIKKENDIDAFFVNDITILSFVWLKNYAKRNNIKLFYDSVEWYSKSEFKLGKFAPEYIKKNIYNKYLIDKSCNVVAISTYLEKYFLGKQIICTRIPVILDIEKIKYQKNLNKEGIINITYAGSPGKKDYISQIIQSLNYLTTEELSKININIVGINKEQIISNFGLANELNKYRNILNIQGRVSRNSVLKILSKSDFTVLLRPQNERYAMAGFPTKFVESLATATPVIANITSDLGMYLKDGINGLAVDNCSVESLAKTIKKAIKLSYEDRKIMQLEARKTAEQSFDYNNYVEELKIYLTKTSIGSNY